jgi:phospholipid/cholesterol/gamma-HCH transport system substrate-binding protein
MKRADEVLVGVVVLIGIAVTVAGSVWLSEIRLGASDIVREARFRSAGQLQVGNPVLLRGVKIGRVESVRLDSTARNQWVRVTLRLKGTEKLPSDPVAIIFSTTLFGDWAVQLLDHHDLPSDPDVRRQVDEAAQGAGRIWAGATLPDVGQLTAQAGRIAGDLATIAGRVQAAFDSSSADKLRGAFRDFSNLSRTLANLASQQQSVLTRIGGNLDTGTASLARFATSLERTASRADSATDREQLRRILSRADSVSGDLRVTAGDLRVLTAAARGQQETFVRIVAQVDTIVGRVAAGQGTIGKLSRDTTLYGEALGAVRDLRVLLLDVKTSPRKYFTFSVF